MLTGTNPFRGGNYTQTVLNHLQLAPPPLPPALADCQELLARMLAKAPEQRFPDCRALLAALDGIELDDPDATRIGPPPSVTREPAAAAATPAKPAKPARARLPLLLGALALAASLTVGGLYWRQQLQIDALLSQAEQRLAAGQLVEPAQDNAEHYFREALRLEQDNPAARAGLERVKAARIAALLALAEQRLAEGRLLEPEQDSADHYFRAALTLDGGHPAALDGLRRLLEARIAAQLARAEQSIAEQRLLLPEEDSAVHYYRQILDWAPGNEAALAGLLRVAQLYRDMANGAYRRGDFPGALAMIERGLQAQPDNAQLLAMRNEHRQLVSSARAARKAAASRPAPRPEPAPATAAAPEPGNPIKRVWNNLFGN
ncbi:Tetratricopeptide repeat protein [compost metagenome]